MDLVVVNVACIEISRPARPDKNPAALHAKVCNQSCNVPAGRWKKAPESLKCEHQPTACQNSENVSEFSGAMEEGSRGFKMQARALYAASLLKMLQRVK